VPPKECIKQPQIKLLYLTARTPTPPPHLQPHLTPNP
jgi:hypothetical protein